MKAVITGGAGFIGSRLAEELLKQQYDILIIDNLISGSKENIPKSAKFVKKDIVKDDIANELEDADVIFHFAADPDVRSSAEKPEKSFNQNVVGTFNVLEACRKNDIERVVFASTSTVYGESETIPTPETMPCEPISNYGASKLACESYVSSYSHSYGIKSTVLRYANIYGPPSTHGVIFDFYKKLKTNPRKLEILGNGKQEKSYLFIDDCISGTMIAFQKQKKEYDVFNIGSEIKHTVDEIAEQVCKNIGISPIFEYTGGERGWVGDVKLMLLDISKLKDIGWKERTTFEQGVKEYISWLKKGEKK